MGHASVVINNRLILVFGGTIDNVNARADLYAFDVGWCSFSFFLSSRGFHLLMIFITIQKLFIG